VQWQVDITVYLFINLEKGFEQRLNHLYFVGVSATTITCVVQWQTFCHFYCLGIHLEQRLHNLYVHLNCDVKWQHAMVV
jgi:hypothetical protein